MEQKPINHYELTAYLKGTNQAQKTVDSLVKALVPYLKDWDKTKHFRVLDIGCGDGEFTFLYIKQLRKFAPKIQLTAIEPEMPAYKKFAQRVANENHNWIKHQNIGIKEFLRNSIGNYEFILFSQCWYHFPKDEWNFIFDESIKLLRDGGFMTIILDSHNCEAYKLKDKIIGAKPETLEFGDLHSSEDIERMLSQKRIKYHEIVFPICLFVKDDEQRLERLARHLAFLYRTRPERILRDHQDDLEKMLTESRKSGNYYTIENNVKIISFKK